MTLMCPGILQICLSIPFLITPSAPMITGTICVFIPHILVISISRSLYLESFSATLTDYYYYYFFSPHDASDRLFHPIHWFQFADDEAVVTSDERENQLLLNCFTRWCQWAKMQIRVDKYITFGIKKFSTRSLQFQPKLLVNSKSVPTVKNGESFKYPGRFFNFEMNNKEHKDLLLSSLHEMLQTVDSLHIHPKNKLLPYHLYISSKLSWHLTVADLSKTWVCEHLDNVVTKYIHQWLELPISATLSAIILSHNTFGLSFQLPSVKFIQCQTVLRSALKSSEDDAITKLWKSTNFGTNIQYDIYKNTKHVLKIFRADHAEKLQSKLPSQGFIISLLLEKSLRRLNSLWSRAQSSLPTNIFNFTIRYLNNTLANKRNLYLWKLATTPDCSFCYQSESPLHVVAGCKSYLEQGRYTWRHNTVLKFLAQTLPSLQPSKLYVDLLGYLSPSILTGESFRPDMLLSIEDKCLYIVELTVGFETNLQRNSQRKEIKYRPFIKHFGNTYRKVKLKTYQQVLLVFLVKHLNHFLTCAKS